MKRLIDWVAQAWVELANERSDWEFMRKSVIFNTVANVGTYAVGPGLAIDLADFRRWKTYSFRQYLQSAGIPTEIILTQYLNYTQFRDFYELGSRRLTTGRPLYVCVAPDRSVKFGFTPNDIYVTTAEYYRSAQVLAADTDTPIIPDEYHMLIVYRAARKYGYFEVASEQIEIAGREAADLHNNLMLDYGPTIEMGDSFI